MRTSILQVVTPELAAVVAGLDAAETARLTAAAERLTLLTRPSRASRGRQRYHPLVREFLEARLRSTIGPEAVARAPPTSRRGGRRQRLAGRRIPLPRGRRPGRGRDDDRRGDPRNHGQRPARDSGRRNRAHSPRDLQLPVLALLLSRIQLQQRNYEPAMALSRAILATVEPGTQESDYALLNLPTLHLQAGSLGQFDTARHAAARDDLKRGASTNRRRDCSDAGSGHRKHPRNVAAPRNYG